MHPVDSASIRFCILYRLYPIDLYPINSVSHIFCIRYIYLQTPQLWIPCVPLPSTRSPPKWMLVPAHKKSRLMQEGARKVRIGEEVASHVMNVGHCLIHQIVKPTNQPTQNTKHKHKTQVKPGDELSNQRPPTLPIIKFCLTLNINRHVPFWRLHFQEYLSWIDFWKKKEKDSRCSSNLFSSEEKCLLGESWMNYIPNGCIKYMYIT